ncbi:phosphohistidine phosphatase SixA [Pseudomonas sp. nanlin1]|uniref:phosphohistidine phosphatase SixA n=1 Tax=Pseudomonas sp. nanlin1 TaxID=3040605 RepID=UPI00388CEE0E
MNLWVLRHGEAHNHAATDAQRELTPRGRKEVLNSAARMLENPPDLIIASPYVRTQQTAVLVHDALSVTKPLLKASWLTPDNDPAQVLDELAKLDHENVLLVSHQPLVGALISLLEHGSVRPAQPMDPASLAELQGQLPLAGSMTLRRVHHSH